MLDVKKLEYDTVISNPPFNLKSENDIKFKNIVVKKKLINFAFIFRGLEKLKDKGQMAFILPNNCLSGSHELDYRKYLIDNNLIKAVISVPGSMFESTSIPTCILLLSKENNENVSFINISECDDKIVLNRRGTGSKAHESRIYHKELGSLSDEQITDINNAIHDKIDIAGFSKTVLVKEVIEQDYSLQTGRYIDYVEVETIHRSFEDIIDDINNIRNDKNKFKITINKTIFKDLKELAELFEQSEDGKEISKDINDALDSIKELREDFKKKNEFTDETNRGMFYTEKRLIYDNWLSITNSAKNEIKNTDKKELCETFLMNLQNCQMMIVYLNNKEIVLLTELRDKLLPLLMSGELEVPKDVYVESEEDIKEPVVENVTEKKAQKTLI